MRDPFFFYTDHNVNFEAGTVHHFPARPFCYRADECRRVEAVLKGRLSSIRRGRCCFRLLTVLLCLTVIGIPCAVWLCKRRSSTHDDDDGGLSSDAAQAQMIAVLADIVPSGPTRRVKWRISR
jgi:hypothetical protein